MGSASGSSIGGVAVRSSRSWRIESAFPMELRVSTQTSVEAISAPPVAEFVNGVDLVAVCFIRVCDFLSNSRTLALTDAHTDTHTDTL